MKKKNIRIDKITVVKEIDTDPDTSFLGEYTDDIQKGVIVRAEHEFYEKLPDDYEIPSKGRDYIGFKPYAGGEKVGTPEYYKYGMADYNRIEGLNNNDWQFIGIYAEAQVSYDEGQGNRRIEKLSSGGLWGIESDSDKAYLKEIVTEQLADLKRHLETFGVDTSNFDEIEVEEKE